MSRASKEAIANAPARWVMVGALTPWDANYKQHPPEQIAELKRSILRAWTRPLVATKDLRLIAGHGALEAAVELAEEDPAWTVDGAPGPGMVPVRILDVSDAVAEELAVADNLIADLGVTDDRALAAALARIMDRAGSRAGVIGAGLGIDRDRLAGIMQRARGRVKAGDSDNPGPPPADPVSVPGTVYELGPHRLLCGSSTDAASWDAVLAGRQWDALWSDPPYGVDYEGKTARKLKIRNDAKGGAPLRELLEAAFALALKHAAPNAATWVAAPAGDQGEIFARVLLDLGLYRQRTVWLKDRFVLGRSDMHYRNEDVYFGEAPGLIGLDADLPTCFLPRSPLPVRHEDVVYGRADGPGRAGRGGFGWFGGNNVDTVFEVPRPAANRDHPTMKPPELIRQQLALVTRPGWAVVDPFGGSGSTMVAAEQLGLSCYLIELDPAYCDVIRRRWGLLAKANGLDAGPDAL